MIRNFTDHKTIINVSKAYSGTAGYIQHLKFQAFPHYSLWLMCRHVFKLWLTMGGMAAARCCSCWMLSWVCLGEGTSTEPWELSNEGFSIGNILQRQNRQNISVTLLIFRQHENMKIVIMQKHTSVLQALLPHPHQHCRWRWSRCLNWALSASHHDRSFLLSPWSQAPSWPESLQSSCPHPEVQFWDARSLRREPPWPFPPESQSHSLDFSLPWHRVPHMRALGPFHCWTELCPGQRTEHLRQCCLPSWSHQTLMSQPERGRGHFLYQSCCHHLREHEKMN